MKTQNNKNNNNPILVTISAFALNFIAYMPASAQVQINCTRGISFGKLAACGTGSLSLAPSGATGTVGCAIVTKAPVAGRCIVNTGGVAPTKNVVVKFTAAFINITNGGSNARVDGFALDHATAPSAKATFTFTPTQVSNTVTLDVGAIMDYGKSYPIGSYSGSIRITAN